MTVPKPGPFKSTTKPVEPKVEIKEAVKRPFVPKPHLTDRPLSGNPALQALKNSMEKEAPKRPVKRNPRRANQARNQEKK